MSRFNQYFLMKNADVIDYVKEKTTFFDNNSELTCNEIGDGNLNYVFHIVDKVGNKSLIVKQAGTNARISEDIVLSTDRIKIESSVLELYDKLAPGFVPKVYLYDDVMNCCVMEDLSQYEIMRNALLAHQTFPLFAEHITTFMVKTTLPTTDVVMNHKEKKNLVKAFINPDLCEISEDLVYTEPFNDYNKRNELLMENKEWITEEIYNDDELRFEAAKLKFQFMNHAQALIHGDLHTGSIFITKNSTKVIDPEFAFYGPIGYDLGNIIANITFAMVNGQVHERKEFVQWAEITIKEIVDLFIEKFSNLWDSTVSEIMAKENGFKQWYLNEVLEDTAAVAGLELIRRIVGLAKVKDITSIKDVDSRVRAERVCLIFAKKLIKNRFYIKTGEDYLKAFKEASIYVNSEVQQ